MKFLQQAGAAVKKVFGFSAGDTGIDRESVEPSNDEAQYSHPEEKERNVVAFMNSSYDSAATRRRTLEKDWALAVAFDEGKQWLRWDYTRHQLCGLVDPDVEYRYGRHNLIRPLTTKWSALVTMSKPDASPAPETDADIDRAAAMEARSILAYLDRKSGRTNQQQRVADWATKCVVFRKFIWNPRANAKVPKFDDSGNVIGRAAYPVGDVETCIVPGFEVFLDANASDWQSVRYLIHECIKPLSWFIEQFGEKGHLVVGTTNGTTANYLDRYMGGGEAAGIRVAPGQKPTSAVCREMWHKPTTKYPQGRLIITGGNRLMYDGPLPYKFMVNGEVSFPFVRYVYREAAGHPYGQGLVSDLVPLQMEYNRMITKMLSRVEVDKPTIFIAKGSGIGADEYTDAEVDIEEGEGLRKVYHNPGFQPGYQAPLPINQAIFQLREIIKSDMGDIAGIHEVSQGGAPAGVTAGVSIELLQQSDRTQMGLFITQMEQNAAEEAEIELSLYSQFASPDLPRMMGLDDSGNPKTAQTRAVAFRALTGGGAVSVLVQPGSAVPKSAAGKMQEVYELLEKGLLGPPSLQTSKMAVRLLSLARSDDILEHLDGMIAEQEAQQAQQVAAMQAQQDAAMQQQNAQTGQAQAVEAQRQQGAAQAALTKGKFDIALEQMRAQNQQQQTAQQHSGALAQTIISELLKASSKNDNGRQSTGGGSDSPN